METHRCVLVIGAGSDLAGRISKHHQLGYSLTMLGNQHVTVGEHEADAANRARLPLLAGGECSHGGAVITN